MNVIITIGAVAGLLSFAYNIYQVVRPPIRKQETDTEIFHFDADGDLINRQKK